MARVTESVGPPTHAEVVAQIDVAVVATDRAGVVTLWNPRAALLYGWREEDAVGRSFAELLLAEGHEQGIAQLMAAARSGRSWQGVVRARRNDGSVCTVFCRQSPMVDADGAPTGSVGVSMDAADAEMAHALSALPGIDGGRRTRLLSPREREILALLARGMTGEQIAERLVLSPETIRTHIRNAREKLGASTRVEAVTLAVRSREIQL